MFISILLVIFAITDLVMAQCSATTCATCFAQSGCGWCVSDGKCLQGGPAGPNAADSCRGVTGTGSERERTLWYFSSSQIISSTAGFPVNPTRVSVYLKPGEKLDIPVQVTAPLPTDQDLDIMFVQDTSGSMADDIQTFRTLATSLVNAVLKLSKTAKTGLASFIEKPVFPQGFPPGDSKYLLADRTVRNYAYRLESPLKSSSLELQKALFRLDATSNRDLPEAAFEALGQVLTCDNIEWRAESRKIIVLTTDAKFHSANDPAKWGTNGVANAPAWNGGCYGIEPRKKYPRANNNYPSKQQIASLFRQKNIIPIFAVAHNERDTTTPTEIQFWSEFQRNQVGFGATVKLDGDSKNLIDLIVTALNGFNQKIALTVTQDNKKLIQGLCTLRNGGNPRACANGNPTSGATYDKVSAGTTKDFRVTLSTQTAVPGETLVLTSPGFGSVIIEVTSNFPCKDCLGVAGGAAKWDKCQECQGGDKCVGCDGVAFSGKVPDMCGTCGGNNVCGKCPGGQFDKCGVCGGQNLCVGCDGVPNSLALFDQCMVCGGQNECIGCDGTMNGPKLDRCGVCGGKNECVGCDNQVTPIGQPVPVNDACGVCNGNNDCQCDKNDPTKSRDQCQYCGVPGDGLYNSCLGCDGIADSGLLYDVCGVCGGNNECVSICDGLPFGKPPDVCGNCTGNGSMCVNFNGGIGGDEDNVGMQPAAEEAAANVVALVVSVLLALLICAALVVAFFIFKSRQDPQWLLPAGMRDGLSSGLADNPLYDGQGGWQSNAINETS